MNEKADVNTKDALLAAAMEIFADKGFDAATVRDICSKAKANVAAVNYHYGGKDALYVAVLEEIFPREPLLPTTVSTMTPEERLRTYVEALVNDIYGRGDGTITQHWSIFLREMAKPSENLDLIVQRQMQPRVDELRDIVASILGPDTLDHVLAFSSSNIWALMLDHLLTKPILDRLTPKRPSVKGNAEVFVEHIVSFSMGGLNAVKNR